MFSNNMLTVAGVGPEGLYPYKEAKFRRVSRFTAVSTEVSLATRSK